MILAALLLTAIPTTFSAAEEKCAGAAGVTLSGVKPREARDPKRAAWLCPVVVRGQVVDLGTDSDAAYKTHAVIHVDATEKGSIPYRDIRLLIDADAQTVSNSEPFLKQGDEVLLFLQSDVEAGRLAAGEYRPCLAAYTVHEETLVSAIPERLEELSMKAALAEVRKTIRALGECRP